MTNGGFGLTRSVLRPADREESDRVTFIELFFDLVFVFALTQLSSYLYENQTLVGALEGTIMVLALWWVWIYTTWVTNWLDPSRLPVRGAVVLLAAVAFVMSTSIAESFADRALAFAVAYVALQLGRTAFMVWATWKHDRELALVFVRVLVWLAVGSVFWIAGAVLPLPFQLPLWGLALAIDYVSASIGFRLPGLGHAGIDKWDISGPHIAERAALFVLIALGEGLLVTGFGFVSLEFSVESAVAMGGAVISAVAMWWIYFDHGEREGSRLIGKSESPGRLARTAYTYVHLAVIAGIVVTSVADEQVLGHPHESSVAASLSILGGPGLFLVGTLLFRWVIARVWMPTHLIGIVALAAGAVLATVVEPLVLGLYSTVVLVGVAAAETIVRLREGREGGG